ncbi:MAG: phosphotransferase [Actinobacteria bacterium]|nr:phosphotransferase [Actinomycetota bacterium]MSY33645.1 phosphotransferase [Actinomycetota bacterium]
MGPATFGAQGGTMTNEVLNTEALAKWIGERMGSPSITVEIGGRPSGGFSAETLLVTARDAANTPFRFVVRLETPEPAVYPTQSDLVMPEIEIQYRIMDALRRDGIVPIAELLGYESDDRILGTPFFVMHHVDGVVPIESPPYSSEGFFTEMRPEQRTSLISSGLQEMARLHSLPLNTIDLGWLAPAGVTPGSKHLANLWKSFGDDELRGRSHPLLDSAWEAIAAELPSNERTGLCWGDPRPGNIIWNGTSPACLTDFEAACIGPPEFDLGWWLMFDRTMHELAGLDRLAGDPTRDEQRSIYFQHAGRPEIDTATHELFAAARYCVIVVRVMNRLEQRGLLPADSMVWRDNPASECLEMIIAERG